MLIFRLLFFAHKRTSFPAELVAGMKNNSVPTHRLAEMGRI